MTGDNGWRVVLVVRRNGPGLGCDAPGGCSPGCGCGTWDGWPVREPDTREREDHGTEGKR